MFFIKNINLSLHYINAKLIKNITLGNFIDYFERKPYIIVVVLSNNYESIFYFTLKTL